MYQYNNTNSYGYPGVYQGGLDFAAIMRRVYLWLALGLVIGFGVAYLVGVVAPGAVGNNPLIWLGALIGYFVLGFGFYPIVQRVSPAVGAVLYIAFTAIFGLLVSSVIGYYVKTDPHAIQSAFLTTAAMFGAMSLFGFITRLDLSRFGAILFMALIGLIIASVVNIFLASGALYWLITYAGVILFSALTAYDTQWIKRNAYSVAQSGNAAVASRVALIGAFRLFLDFVNLFLYILRIFGGGRR